MYEDGRVLMIDTTCYRLRAINYDERENTLEHGKISCNTYTKDLCQLCSKLGYTEKTVGVHL